MSSLALTSVTFRAGATAGADPLRLEPGVVTLLVGPNSSGKSRALAELYAWAQGSSAQGLVVRDATAEIPDNTEDVLKVLDDYVQEDPRPSVVRIAAPAVPGVGGGQEEFPLQQLAEALAQPDDDGLPEHLRGARRRWTLRWFSALWSGRERFSLAQDQALGHLQRPPENHLQVLFRDDELRKRVRTMIYEAFDMYFVLDPTEPGQVRMRLSAVPPPNPTVERGLDEPAIAFHRNTLALHEQSDGIQCYVGMLVTLLSSRLRLILVDEPEAFLHPPLARRLGGALSAVARERNARLVAATHSADFLRGCVESAASTSIVRLTYERQTNAATARALNTNELRPLMAEPLLRSTRALEGLFHRAVVVGESDADRAFYDEINRRLVAAGRGIADAQFINAQNWSTEGRVIGPLRRLGVPTVGILDLDTLWNSKSEWRSIYRAVGLPDDHEHRLALESAQAELARDRNERKACKAKGVSGLPQGKREAMRALIRDLALYGIFIVPVGELEAWLPELSIPRTDKHDWIVRILTRLGTDPDKAGYVHPGRGGVWRFLDSIEGWVADPERRGMPAA
jgi:energy-coupling factor transporter ATP-binding protein EcfA2